VQGKSFFSDQTGRSRPAAVHILDLIAMAIEKIDHENQIYEDFLHLRLETKNDQSLNEDDF